MARSLHHYPHVANGAGAGVLAWMRGWLETWRKFRSAPPAQMPVATVDRIAAPQSGAQVLPFPIRGEALLVQLAEKLQVRIGQRTWSSDPLLLVLSRRPHTRLTIDRDTFVEFDPRRFSFRAVIDAGPNTRVTIDTADFDAVVSFIAQYVNRRLADAVALDGVL